MRVLFKRPDPAGAEAGEIYSMGMERVAYALGEELGLPLPVVHLEEYEGHWGSLQRFVPNSRSWMQAPGCPMLMNQMVNEDQLPECFVFDAWLANTDRVSRNILAQADPPTKPPKSAQRCRTWLIDNGCTGLWFPSKFDRSLTGQPVEQVHLRDGMIRDDVRRSVLGAMPPRYRRACRALSPDRKDEILGHVRAVENTVIETVVAEVPSDCMSDQAKELTTQLLVLRRDRIEEIYEALVP